VNTELAIVGGRLVLDAGVADRCSVVVRDGVIAEVCPDDRLPEGLPRVDVGGRLVVPGLIDLHIHGALGHSFSDATAEAFDAILGFLASRGVTTAQASLSSDALERLEQVMDFVQGYQPSANQTGLAGVHLEGPFLSYEQRGAHNPDLLRLPQPGDAQRLLAYRAVLRMVTLAPELPDALQLAQELVAGGVTVAAGHSATGAEQLDAASGVGLSHITHLWSGQSNLTRSGPWRSPGFVEASLASSGLTAEIIADGKHLPPELLTIARRCLGERLCLVSDGISGTGLPEGTRFEDDGGMATEIRNGVCMLADGSSFAGSTTPLNTMLAYLVRELGWPVAEAVTMASTTPAAVLRVADRKGAIKGGYDADIAILDDDFACWGTLIGGEWAYGPAGDTRTTPVQQDLSGATR
jgi:N-acetylglucosamine-6-phosphate deacetylase